MRLTSGRAQQGQASPEFLGLTVFAVAVVVTLALSAPSVGRDVGATFKRAICVVGAPMTGETCPARPAKKPRPPKDPCATAAGDARVAPSPPPPPKASWGGWGAQHGVTLPDPQSTSPAQVSATLGALSPADQDQLAQDFPDVVGRLDGAPPRMRYEANRVAMHQTVDHVRAARATAQAEICRIQGVLKGHDPNSPPSSVDGLLANRLDHLKDDVAGMDSAIKRYEGWAQPGRHFLLFDPEGDGRVAEVFGNLDTARDVAVVVPGMGNQQSNFDTQLRPKAQALYGEAGWRAGNGVATIAWLGYDAPEGASAALPGAADDGAPHLAPFLEGIDVSHDRHLTVIGHSYGSLLLGTAVRQGAHPADVVFVGSPGVGVQHRPDLGSGFTVWAAHAPLDPVPDFGWFGPDPASSGFGANVFETGENGSIFQRHSSYFLPNSESLKNVARIVTGHGDEVTGG